MPLSWNEIKSRALAFSREWADASDEASQAKPFWIAFFEIFGITNKRVATFEHAVKKYGGGQGYVDLFWPGVLLVEQKSRGRDLDRAWMTRLFDELGWVDVYRSLYPEHTGEAYTWWSNRGQAWTKNVGWRIDYQIATPGIAARAQSAFVYKDQRFSDHGPLVVDYDYEA